MTSASRSSRSARASGSSAITIDASDNLFVVDSGNAVVRKITATGVVSAVAGTPKVPGNADGPAGKATLGYGTGLVVDAKGNLFMTDYEADAVRKITPDGTISTVAGTRGIRGTLSGPLPGSLAGPSALALTADGDLLVSTIYAVMQITAP